MVKQRVLGIASEVISPNSKITNIKIKKTYRTFRMASSYHLNNAPTNEKALQLHKGFWVVKNGKEYLTYLCP